MRPLVPMALQEWSRRIVLSAPVAPHPAPLLAQPQRAR